MDVYEKPDELYHYGRLGMKWGKHIFGRDKTASGRIQKVSSRTDQGEFGSSGRGSPGYNPKPKSHKEMTDDELRRETERFNLEANYLNARNRANPSSGQPQKKESFSKKFVDGAIKPALVEVGKKQIENYLNTNLDKLIKGKPNPNSLESLRKEAERLGLQSKISTAKKVIDSNEQYFADKKKKEAQEQVETVKTTKDKPALTKTEEDREFHLKPKFDNQQKTNESPASLPSENHNDRLIKASNVLSKMAAESSELVRKADAGEKYLDELLKKNKDKLS